MSPEAQRIAIAGVHLGLLPIRGERVSDLGHLIMLKADGTTTQFCPNYLADLNAMHEARAVIRDNAELRVKYLNALRRVVARRCPKNKSGMSLVSDFHQLDASAAEHAEAFLSTLGLWKEDA